MTWQFNWKVWTWFWWSKKRVTDIGHKPIISNFAGFGPFQFHWYSKVHP